MVLKREGIGHEQRLSVYVFACLLQQCVCGDHEDDQIWEEHGGE